MSQYTRSVPQTVIQKRGTAECTAQNVELNLSSSLLLWWLQTLNIEISFGLSSDTIRGEGLIEGFDYCCFYPSFSVCFDKVSLQVEQINRSRKDGKKFTAKVESIGPKEVVYEHLAELSAVCHDLEIGDEPDINFPSIDDQDRSIQNTSTKNSENADTGNEHVYTQLLPPQPVLPEVALNQQQVVKKHHVTTFSSHFLVFSRP